MEEDGCCDCCGSKTDESGDGSAIWLEVGVGVELFGCCVIIIWLLLPLIRIPFVVLFVWLVRLFKLLFVLLVAWLLFVGLIMSNPLLLLLLFKFVWLFVLIALFGCRYIETGDIDIDEDVLLLFIMVWPGSWVQVSCPFTRLIWFVLRPFVVVVSWALWYLTSSSTFSRCFLDIRPNFTASRDIPKPRHFCRRQNWHLFLFTRSTTQFFCLGHW